MTKRMPHKLVECPYCKSKRWYAANKKLAPLCKHCKRLLVELREVLSGY